VVVGGDEVEDGRDRGACIRNSPSTQSMVHFLLTIPYHHELKLRPLLTVPNCDLTKNNYQNNGINELRLGLGNGRRW